MPIEAVRAVTGGKVPRQHGAMEYSAAPVDLDLVRRYRLGRIAGLLAAAGLLAGFLLDGPGAANLKMVAGAVIVVQGLAVAHALVKESGLGYLPLVVLYAAMVFAGQLVMPLVLAAGLVDNWLDLRGKLISRK